MLQQVVDRPEKIIFKEMPIPEIESGSVLIKIHSIGICGSDVRVFTGTHPNIVYPVTQGREAAGEIVAVGADVQNLFVGQRVTVQPQVICGECSNCRAGRYNLCEKLQVRGQDLSGMASEYFAVEADRVAPLQESVSYEEGTMIEPLAVAVHAVKKAGNLNGKKILVLGAGPVGLIIAQAAKGMSNCQVAITDISNYRLDVAKRCGIDFCINTAERNLEKELLKTFGTNQVDIVYDCAGTNITIGQAVHYVTPGSRIILVAVFKGMASVDLAELADKELKLYTSMMYRNEDYLDAISLVEEKKVKLYELISKRFEFKQYEEAYRYLIDSRDKAVKVVINL